MANLIHADLFISVHANFSPDHSQRGIEIYYMDSASSNYEQGVARQENGRIR